MALPHDWWEAKPSPPHRTGSESGERLFYLSPACSTSTLPSLSPTGRWQPVGQAWTPPGPCCQQTSEINHIREADSVERISKSMNMCIPIWFYNFVRKKIIHFTVTFDIIFVCILYESLVWIWFLKGYFVYSSYLQLASRINTVCNEACTRVSTEARNSAKWVSS